MTENKMNKRHASGYEESKDYSRRRMIRAK